SRPFPCPDGEAPTSIDDLDRPTFRYAETFSDMTIPEQDPAAVSPPVARAPVERPAGRIRQGAWHEAQLEQPRRKPRSPAMSVAYRITRLLQKLVGPERVLRGQLFAAWLLHRLAF